MAEDDVMVDVHTWQKLVELNGHIQKGRQFPIFPFLCAAGLHMNTTVERRANSSGYVPPAEYKWPTFPRSCSGGLYSFPGSLLAKMWRRVRKEPLVRFDNAVWLTGVMRMKLGVPDEAVLQPPRTAVHRYCGARWQASDRCGGEPVGFSDFMEFMWLRMTDDLRENAADHCTCDEDDDGVP